MGIGTISLKGSTGRGTGCTEWSEARAEEAKREEAGEEARGRGVILRVARMRKLDRIRKLVILFGYARAAEGQHEGKFRRVEIRALVDTGAEGDFISPSMARRLGAKTKVGEYGFALGLFAERQPIREEVRDLELSFQGIQAGSGLMQTFNAQHDVLVAPKDLSDDYDLILGFPFLWKYHARIGYNSNQAIELKALNGATTTFPAAGLSEQEARADGEEEEEEEGELEEDGINTIEWRAMEIESEIQRRLRIQDDAAGEEEDTRRAAAARVQLPNSIMTFEELEREWHAGAQGSLTVFPILFNGRVEETQVARVAHGRQADQGSEEEEQGALPMEERARADGIRDKLVKEFKDVFTDELPAITPEAGKANRAVDIVLKPGAQPAGRYGPRMTQEHTEIARTMIEELLQKGFIRPSKSPWGAPMFLVDKPDGTKRMVIDYRALNAATVRNRYPLPRTDELFDQLLGAQFFSKIDLRTGYWQIRMAEAAVEKTAFTSRHGHFEWLVLPMGLTNAPAEFMAMMEDTFREELNRFILVFLDDILVYSRTMEEHEGHLRAAMQKLRDKGLHGKLSKCQFLRSEVEFLGHHVGRAGVRMVEGKVEAVQRWPVPTRQKEVEQFIGLSGYYRRFIKDFSKIASPLTELCGTLKKAKGGAQRTPPKKAFAWGEEQQKAFEAIKEAVTSAPCLAMPDPEKEFIVHTDASGYAVGAALMQKFEGGLRPIAFLSKKMKKSEKNYPVYEQELLAILTAARAWRHYLAGRHFTVVTDHQSLQYLESSVMATARQLKWAALLQEFSYTIVYRPGRENAVADALSRAAAGAPTDPAEEDEPRYLMQTISTMRPIPVRVSAAIEEDEAYQAHLALSDAELARRKLIKDNGMLYKEYQGEQVLLVPESAGLREWLLSYAHDPAESAHRGSGRMHEWLRKRVYWPNMEKDARGYATSCEACQQGKPDLEGRQGLPLSAAIPRRAGEVICMDFIGPFQPTGVGEDAIMVVVDKLTRYSVYVPLKITSTAQDIFRLLDTHWLAYWGAPGVIISDRDSRFTSHFWQDLWKMMSVELKMSTAFHPQSNGQTERQNRTLIEALRAFVNEQRNDWGVLLPQLQRAANSSVSASTGFSPDKMMTGREMVSHLDLALEQEGVAPRSMYPGAQALHESRAAAEETARKNIEAAQEKQRRDAEKGRRAPGILVGDRVWLSNKNMAAQGPGGSRKLEPLYLGPYRVLELKGSNAAKLELPAGCLLHPVFNMDLLRKYVDGSEAFPDRPARHERPGPVPEEDPEAGGPGDPIYEVEEVIGARGRGNRKRYKVLWKGWPRDQASWIGIRDCTGCTDLIAEFEARQVAQRQQRLQANKVELQHRTKELLSWAARVQAPTPQQLELRAKHKAEAEANHPKDAHRPRVDAKGQIDMGAQRCVADTKAGCWCRLSTRHGCLCWVHRASLSGTQIKKSTIEGAGLGLFARRAFKTEDVIATYTGDLIPTGAGWDREDGFEGSQYVLELSEQVAVDAARTNTGDGRMMNDPRGTGQRANVRFCANQRTKTVTMRATRNIKAGDEFLVSYGRGFWSRKAEAGSKEKPIVINQLLLGAPREYQFNMLAHSQDDDGRIGRWQTSEEERWECDCRGPAKRRSHLLPYCPDCETDRPPHGAQPIRSDRDRDEERAEREAALEAQSTVQVNRGRRGGRAPRAVVAVGAAGYATTYSSIAGAHPGFPGQSYGGPGMQMGQSSNQTLARRGLHSAMVNRGLTMHDALSANRSAIAAAMATPVQQTAAEAQEAGAEEDRSGQAAQYTSDMLAAITWRGAHEEEDPEQVALELMATTQRGGAHGGAAAAASSSQTQMSEAGDYTEDWMKGVGDGDQMGESEDSAAATAANMRAAMQAYAQRDARNQREAYAQREVQRRLAAREGAAREAAPHLPQIPPILGLASKEDLDAAARQRQQGEEARTESNAHLQGMRSAAIEAEVDRGALGALAARGFSNAIGESSMQQAAREIAGRLNSARGAAFGSLSEEEEKKRMEEHRVARRREAAAENERLTLLAIEQEHRRKVSAPARWEEWNKAPSMSWADMRAPGNETVTHGQRGTRSMGTAGAPPIHQDCRGIASVYNPAQKKHSVMRVPGRRAGYCRRRVCECCAPMKDDRGNVVHTDAFCSCLAAKDGLCRRCWIDFFVDHKGAANEYWGPEA